MTHLNVGFVVDYFWPHVGGMETWTLEVSRELVRRGHEVHVYTYKTRGRTQSEFIDGIRVHRFGSSHLASFFGDFRPYPYLLRIPMLLGLLVRAAREFRQFDRVFVSYVPLALLAPYLRLMGNRVWGVFHGPVGEVASRSAPRKLLSYAAQMLAAGASVGGFIAVGNYVKRSLTSQGVPAWKIIPIRGGVSLTETDSVRAEKSEDPQICFLGRLTREKRLDELLRAFLPVKAKFPNATIAIIGDGPMGTEWQRLAESLSLSGAIRFLGVLHGSQKIKILKQSHLLVLPSYQEGMNLAVFESLACRTPVIAYDIPAIREQIELTGGGVTVTPGDIEGLAAAIVSLLSDASLRNQMSRRAREKLHACTWERVAAALLETIRRN